MTVRYHRRRGRSVPDYVCQKQCVEHAKEVCQQIPGGGVDEAVGELLINSLTPLALETALNVQEEIQSRLAEVERLRQQQLQRAQYEAEQARIRFMRVDPNNRLVADSLEGQWNQKLLVLTQVQEECEKQRQEDSAQLSRKQKEKIMSLASKFPKLWQDPKTTDRDRKRMARLLLEDVTLLREQQEIRVEIRFKGGATKQMRLPFPKAAWALRKTKAAIVAEIDQLLNKHTEGEIAELLNRKGWRSGSGAAFTLRIVNNLRRAYKLRSRYERLQQQGLLTIHQIAEIIGIDANRTNYWRQAGVLKAIQANENHDYLYEKPTPGVVEEIQRRRIKTNHEQPKNKSHR